MRIRFNNTHIISARGQMTTTLLTILAIAVICVMVNPYAGAAILLLEIVNTYALSKVAIASQHMPAQNAIDNGDCMYLNKRIDKLHTDINEMISVQNKAIQELIKMPEPTKVIKARQYYSNKSKKKSKSKSV